MKIFTPGKMTRASLRDGIEKAFPDVTPDRIDAAPALVDARDRALGISPDEWIEKRIGELRRARVETRRFVLKL